MADLRTAAQQALKALEMLGYPLAAITSLRAALAQQEQKPVQAGLSNAELTDAWCKKLPGVIPTDRDLTAFALGVEFGFDHSRDLERQDWIRVLRVLAKHGLQAGRTDEHLADMIDRALAQEEQEPVATVAMDVSGAHLSWNGKYLGQKPDTKIAMLLKDLPVGTLLFTAPPSREWRELTEDEIRMAYGNDLKYRDGDYERFARAIEAKLKEKNA